MNLLTENETMRSFKELFTQVHHTVFAAFLFSGLVSILMLVTPLYGWQLLDHVTPQFNFNSMLVLSAFALGAVLTAFILDAARYAILLRAAVWLDHVPGQLLFENGIRRAAAARDVQGDAQALDVLRRFLVGRDLAPLLELPWAPIYLVGLLLINPLIALVVLTSTLLMIAITLWHAFATHNMHDDVAASFQRRRNFEQNFLGHSRLLRSLGFANGASSTWELINRRFVAGAYSLGKRTLLSRGLSNDLRLICELGVLAVGAWLLMMGQLTIGALIAAIFLNARVLGTLRHFNDTVPELRKAQRAYARLSRLRAQSLLPAGALSTKRQATAKHDAAKHSTAKTDAAKQLVNKAGKIKQRGNLSLNNVALSYPGYSHCALQGIDLDLSAGECLVISGPMQSGKSTFAALLAGALAPSRGLVLLDGEELGARQAASDGPLIGYVPDEPFVLEGTVHQNIVGFSNNSVMSAAQAAMEAGVHDVLADLPGGYDYRIGGTGGRLSLRHRRAITLARAVYGAPDIIVIDTPEIGLNEREVNRLARFLQGLHEAGATLILASNEPRIQRLADRVVLLENATIAAIGPVHDVLQFDDEFVEACAPWRDGRATLGKFKGDAA